MKYNQPFGITTPSAPYINGNPSTGSMGSIPPAEAIEYPQREIVNAISDANLSPSNSDLHQLAKGVQTCHYNYGDDVGTTNHVVVVLTPVPDAYYAGMVVRFRALHAPTGASDLDAGRGAKPIKKQAGGNTNGSEWSVGDVVTVTYDGTNWTMPIPPQVMLYAPRDFYVNDSTGNDANDGLTAGTPFKTLQKAQNMCALFNLNGYSIYIHVANGNYGPVSCGPINGAGQINYIGNPATPNAVVVTNTAGSAFGITVGLYLLNGFKVVSTGRASGQASAGVWMTERGLVYLQNMEWGAALDGHLVADAAARAVFAGNTHLLSGNSAAHVVAANASYVNYDPVSVPNIAITAAITITSGFVLAQANGSIALTYGTITNPGNVTGPKYSASVNGVINSVGGGVNYYPGTVAGATSTGGQYV
jgi:hypothetical protein